MTKRRTGEHDESYYNRVAARWFAAMAIALVVALFCRVMSVVTA